MKGSVVRICDKSGNEHDGMIIDKLRCFIPNYNQDLYLVVKSDGSTFYGNFIRKVYYWRDSEESSAMSLPVIQQQIKKYSEE